MSPDEPSQWQRAYDASIAEQEAHAAEAARDLDPAWRRHLEIRAGFGIIVTVLGFAGLGVGLLVVGPWYVSVIGVMLVLGAGLAAAGAVKEHPWRMR